MTLRKWIVRGLVLTVVGGLTAGGFVYLHWTDPAVIRQQVIAQLSEHLPGAFVALDSARLHLLGGIAFQELRLTRRDDADRIDLLYVPGGVIYHDKEQLARGKLAIRKIELQRPRFRVIRGRDGQLNVKGIIGPVDLSRAIPTIVIQQGSILFEDRNCPALPVVEIRDLSLTLLNDPLPTLVFQGTGLTDLAGLVQVRGSWQRASGELETTIDVPTIPVGPALVQRLAAYLPRLAEDARHLDGTGKLNAHFHYRPESQEWDHDLHAQLTSGRLQHALIPVPLDELEAAARLSNGRVTLETLTARAGTARLHAAGVREAFHDSAETRGTLKVVDLTLTTDLFEKLPAPLRKIHADFAPAGPVDLTWTIQQKGEELLQEGTVTAKGLSLCCNEFRYPAENVAGTIDVQVAPEGHMTLCRLDLTGTASGQPLRITGNVHGPKPAAVDLAITAQNIPLDEKLLAALPERFQGLARSFHAEGRSDVEAFVSREQGEEQFRNRYLVRFRDLAVRYDAFPYPLQRGGGVLEILPDHWEARELFGTYKGAVVHGHGRSQPLADGGHRIDIELRGKNLLIDADLKQALENSKAAVVKPAWETFQPSGRADFHVLLTIPPGSKEPELDVTAIARSCSVLPSFLPWALTDLHGTLRYTRGRVELRDLSARHGDSVVRFREGDVMLKPGGGFFVVIPNFQANPLVPDAEFVRALPAPLRAGVTALQLRDPVSLAAEVRVDMPGEAGVPPVVYWDGGLALQNASVRLGVPFQKVSGRVFCRGRHNGRQLEGVLGHAQLDQAALFDQPFKNIHGRFEVWKDTPDMLRVPQLTANLFGGTLGGQAHLEFGPTVRYQLDLTALQIKLEQLGRHNLKDKAELSGEAVARLFLQGEGTELSGLEGGGSIDIPNGKLYNLPLLLDLLKFLSVRWPDRTAFEEAHVRFTIHGPKMQINRLELLGNALSFGGTGQMNLDGSDMDLELYTVWGRIMQMLPAGVKEVPPWISRNLLKIKARGPLTKPQFDKEPVPVLVDPLKGLLQRMTGTR